MDSEFQGRENGEYHKDIANIEMAMFGNDDSPDIKPSLNDSVAKIFSTNDSEQPPIEKSEFDIKEDQVPFQSHTTHLESPKSPTYPVSGVVVKNVEGSDSSKEALASEVLTTPASADIMDSGGINNGSDSSIDNDQDLSPHSPQESQDAQQGQAREFKARSPASKPSPYVTSRRSWFQRTPLSTMQNPPGIRIGSEPRSPEFLWNQHRALRKASRTEESCSFMLGWEEARALERTRLASPSAFLPRSPRTQGFPLRDLRRAREWPAPGQYRHWSDADSRRPGAARAAFTKGGRAAPIFDLAGPRARPVLTVRGAPDQSRAAPGRIYSGFSQQSLSGNPSGPAVGFGLSARIGASAAHAPGRGPGPGEYDLVIDPGAPGDVLVRTRHRAAPRFSMPKELRPWQGRPRETEQHPYPRAFTATPLEDSAGPRRLARHQTAPAWRFGSGARMAARPQGTPGPGSYYV